MARIAKLLLRFLLTFFAVSFVIFALGQFMVDDSCDTLLAKPVIYLYPEEPTDVTVKLDVDGHLTAAYPAYGDGWQVLAAPDGTLTDESGRTYYCLYWEAEANADFAFDEGFCIPGSDTAAFLEDALAKLGLTEREANEFIVYWLPQMQDNAYNRIAFQTEAYEANAKLSVMPAADTVIRVFMTWQGLDAPVEIVPQSLAAPDRIGFTVVEWGGAEIR